MDLHDSSSVDLAFLVSQIADGMYFTDESGTFRYANDALASILGAQDVSHVVGKNFLDFVDPDTVEALKEQFARSMLIGEERDSIEVRIQRPDGIFRWIEVRPTRVREGGHLHGSFGILRDITERKEHEENLRNLAVTDELTNLYNRRGFKTLVSKNLARAREMGQAISLLFIDIDGFKHINDSHGHEEGDRALLIISHVLLESFRRQDVIGRWGGDEFIVAALDVPGGAVQRLSNRFQEKLERRCADVGLSYPLTATIGSSDSESSRSYSLGKLLADADADLYRRKKARRVHEDPRRAW